MALNLYLDDCAFSYNLANLLRRAGHIVTTPLDAGLLGRTDEVHMDHASQNGLALLTKNPADFLFLHEQNPNHHGILVISRQRCGKRHERR